MNEKQEQAVLLLTTGKTGAQVAEELQVTQKTISTWRGDPEFKAALNQHMADIKLAHAERLRNLCGLALNTIEDCLNDKKLLPKERLCASFKLLELGNVTPTEPGLTDAKKIAREDFLDSF